MCKLFSYRPVLSWNPIELKIEKGNRSNKSKYCIKSFLASVPCTKLSTL